MSQPKFPRWGIIANWIAGAVFLICAYLLKLGDTPSFVVALIPGSVGLAAMIVHRRDTRQYKLNDMRNRIESLRRLHANEERRLDDYLKRYPDFPRYDVLEFDMRYNARRTSEIISELEDQLEVLEVAYEGKPPRPVKFLDE